MITTYQEITEKNGFFHRQRMEQLVKIFYDFIENSIKDRFYHQETVVQKITEMIPLIRTGKITPYQAGSILLHI
jgi:LAO/AO transport system kinase